MSTSDGGSTGPKGLWILFGLVMLGAMAALVVVLSQECGAGEDAVRAYVERIAGGEDVSEAVAGPEAASLTEMLRSSTRVHIDNFQAQAGTACFWTTVSHAGGQTDVQFLLHDGEQARSVHQVSAVRECSCPDPDFEQPCHLVGR